MVILAVWPSLCVRMCNFFRVRLCHCPEVKVEQSVDAYVQAADFFHVVLLCAELLCLTTSLQMFFLRNARRPFVERLDSLAAWSQQAFLDELNLENVKISLVDRSIPPSFVFRLS